MATVLTDVRLHPRLSLGDEDVLLERLDAPVERTMTSG